MERPGKLGEERDRIISTLFNPLLWAVVGLLLFGLALWTPSCAGASCHGYGVTPPVTYNASVIELVSPMAYSRSLNAGYGAGENSSPLDLGNKEGSRPGKVVEYAVPSDVVDGGLMVTGSWRSDPDGLTHVGAGRGLVMAAFTEPAADILASFSSAAHSPDASTDILVFFDGEYVRPAIAGADVSIVGGTAVLRVSSLKTYHVLKDVPPGRHLLLLAAQSDGFSIKKMLFK